MFTNRVRTLSKPGLGRNAVWRISVHLFVSLWLCFSQIRITTVTQLLCVDTVTPWRLWHGYNIMIIHSHPNDVWTQHSHPIMFWTQSPSYISTHSRHAIVLYISGQLHTQALFQTSQFAVFQQDRLIMFQHMKSPLELLTQPLPCAPASFSFPPAQRRSVDSSQYSLCYEHGTGQNIINPPAQGRSVNSSQHSLCYEHGMGENTIKMLCKAYVVSRNSIREQQNRISYCQTCSVP